MHLRAVSHILRLKATVSAFIGDLSIKIKLLLCFITFSTVFVSSVGIISYSKSSNTINRQSLIYSDSILKQVIDRIEKLKYEVMNISIPFVLNPSIQKNDFQTLEYIQFIQRKRAIEAEFSTIMMFKKDIGSIYMCVEPDMIFSPNNFGSRDEMNYKNYLVYRNCIGSVSVPVWTSVHENEFSSDESRNVLTFSRSLYDNDEFQPFGSLIINIPVQVLKETCKINASSTNYNIFIIDKKGNTVFNSLGKKGSENIPRGYLNHVVTVKETESTFRYKADGRNYLVEFIHSKDREWIYIAEVPIDYLMENSTQVKSYIITILLAALIVSFAAAYLISAYFTGPLRKMIKTMHLVEMGDFQVKTGIGNRSEIGLLSQSFDHMIEEIRNLIYKLGVEHEEKRKEELNTLQAQITPHFLYNSLNAIKCMARIQKVSGIEEMTTSLIELLQMSISKRTVYITISEEIALTRKYILLQNFRYGNKFSVTYDYDDDVLKYLTIKMVLQPLLENSLFHGVDASNGNAVIRIRVYRKQETVYMEVEDNGVGMTEEQIHRVLNEDNGRKRRFSGIGIKNVNERIRMHFGERYGLTFRSEPGKYTVAIITLPAVEEMEVRQNV